MADADVAVDDVALDVLALTALDDVAAAVDEAAFLPEAPEDGNEITVDVVKGSIHISYI